MLMSTVDSISLASYPLGRSFFDIAHRSHFLMDPTLNTYLGYLKQAKVQQALGTPVNFTDQATNVAHAFSLTGDNVRGEYVEILPKHWTLGSEFRLYTVIEIMLATVRV